MANAHRLLLVGEDELSVKVRVGDSLVAIAHIKIDEERGFLDIYAHYAGEERGKEVEYKPLGYMLGDNALHFNFKRKPRKTDVKQKQ